MELEGLWRLFFNIQCNWLLNLDMITLGKTGVDGRYYDPFDRRTFAHLRLHYAFENIV